MSLRRSRKDALPYGELGSIDMDTPEEQTGNKKIKILIILTASIATSLAFVVLWFSNHMRYEEYSKDMFRSFTKKYGTNFSALGEKKLYEAEEVIEKNLEILKCLNRYRKENHSFALALTACKQELFIR